MRRTNQGLSTSLSKRQFITLCHEVATEANKIWEQNPQIEKKTALLKRLISKVQSKMGVESGGFPPYMGATPEETAYLSSLAAVCNTLTSYGRVSIGYDCIGTITEELFNKVEDVDQN